MSRLLTLFLLYRSGYIVGKYINLEMIIEKTKITYSEKLEESSREWLETKHSYLPFVKYYLKSLLNAYREFSLRVEHVHNNTLPKHERINQKYGLLIELRKLYLLYNGFI